MAYNTRLKSKTQNGFSSSPAAVPETQPGMEEDFLNSTVREGDDSFVSIISSDLLSSPRIRKSLSTNNIQEINQLAEENHLLKETIERLQMEHMQMENAVIKKDESIIKLELEVDVLRKQIESISSDLQILKSIENNIQSNDNVHVDTDKCVNNVPVCSENPISSRLNNTTDDFNDFDSFIAHEDNVCNLTFDSFDDFDEFMLKLDRVEKLERNVLFVGDSHMRGITALLQRKLNASFNCKVQSYFYPGASIGYLSQRLVKLSKHFTSDDFVIS